MTLRFILIPGLAVAMTVALTLPVAAELAS
jgi:hypothetical protein